MPKIKITNIDTDLVQEWYEENKDKWLDVTTMAWTDDGILKCVSVKDVSGELYTIFVNNEHITYMFKHDSFDGIWMEYPGED